MNEPENNEDQTTFHPSGSPPNSSQDSASSAAHDATTGFTGSGTGRSSGGGALSGNGSGSELAGNFQVNQPSAGVSVATRFEIQKEHAKGGLGKVFIAQDHQLDRQVALKQIRSRYADDVGARQRFELEACVTGGLEHPGIVPVYSFGRGDDDRPFYAMRFISGETLKEAILELHREYESEPRKLFQCTTFRNMLDGFVDSCQAIGYAHSRGIVHRDIKPSNIMLGEFGETLVVDWGLAKCVGREQHFADFDASTLMNLSGSSHAETSYGSTIGTPPFMSPEQANGDVDEIGPRSDIYSLGATLYMILTGLPPFKGKNASDIVDQVKQGQFQFAHERNSEVPRALSEVSGKAMSLSPDDRYMTAIDLAVEVKAWMADKPTMAYRDPWTTRARRWLKEHRTFAVASAVGLLTVLTGSILASVFLNAEKNRTAEALASLEIEQSKTVAALSAESAAREQSQSLLDAVSSDLVGDLLSQREELTGTDKKFLQQMLTRFEAFAETDRNQISADALANGHLRIARIRHRLGEFAQAGQAAEKATNLYQELVESDSPQAVNLNKGLGRAFAQQALSQSKLGNQSESLNAWKQAEVVWTGLFSSNKDDIDVRANLASVSINKANALHRQGETTDAQVAYSAGIQLLESVDPNELGETWTLALNQGLANRAGQLAESPESHQQAAEIYQRCSQSYESLAESSPTPKIQYLLSNSQLNTGNVLISMKRHSQALPLFVAATERQEQLAEQFPLRRDYQYELGRAQLGLGETLDAMGKAGAIKNLIAAENTFRSLTGKLPNAQGLLARAMESLANHYLKDSSSEVDSKRNLDLGKKLLGEAKEIRKLQLESDKDNKALQTRMLITEINWASHLRKTGKYEDAQQLYTPLLERLDRSGIKTQNQLMRAVLFGLGDVAVEQKNFDLALKCWSRLCEDFTHPNWNLLELQRAIALARTGKISEGVSVSESLLLNAEVTPVMHYDAGCCCAVAAEELAKTNAKATADGKPTKNPAAAGRDADWYRKRAMDHLADAIDAGFLEEERMRAHMQSDPDLASLHDNKDFQELCKKNSITIEKQ